MEHKCQKHDPGLNYTESVALGWNSVHSMCTIRKLRFLHRVVTNEESICYCAFSAMVDDMEALSQYIIKKDQTLLAKVSK